MADKPTVKYEVRAQKDPINNVTIYVPAIVDRNAAKSLATVIENAIDRGLIDGDFWNRDVTLRLYWADGTVSEKALHFLQS